MPAEILGGFSSSLLPLSLPRGRLATVFLLVRAARRDPHRATSGRASWLRRSEG